MSTRTSDTTLINAVSQDQYGFVLLAELDFADGLVRVWAGPEGHAITFDGKIWTGTGDLASLSPFKEAEKGNSSRITGTLRVTGDILAQMEDEDNEGREATFLIPIYDIADKTFKGHYAVTFEMSSSWAEPRFNRRDGKKELIHELKMEFIGEAEILDRVHVRRLTHTDTLEIDPNDNFNEFASSPDISQSSVGPAKLPVSPRESPPPPRNLQDVRRFKPR